MYLRKCGKGKQLHPHAHTLCHTHTHTHTHTHNTSGNSRKWRQLTEQKKQHPTPPTQKQTVERVHTRVDAIVRDDVAESRVIEATVTAVISKATRAVDKLLLGKRHKLAARNLVGSFDSACCRKCPARPAVALIFDWCHSAASSPVLQKVFNARWKGVKC